MHRHDTIKQDNLYLLSETSKYPCNDVLLQENFIVNLSPTVPIIEQPVSPCQYFQAFIIANKSIR